MKPSAQELIRQLDLQPHPEGGFYRETYRADGFIASDSLGTLHKGDAPRRYSTAIYYLLTQGSQSRLHKIASDELWHFYLGDPLVVCEIDPDTRQGGETLLGQDLFAGQRVQHRVPAGRWFGAYLPEGSAYALVGCTVAPGFDFADLVFAERDKMLAHFPGAQGLIERLLG